LSKRDPQAIAFASLDMSVHSRHFFTFTRLTLHADIAAQALNLLVVGCIDRASIQTAFLSKDTFVILKFIVVAINASS
jgi:hypothetical protein